MKRELFFPLISLLAVVWLSGCAERWQKPGASEYEFEGMKSACISHATAQFPPLMREVQVNDAYTTPVVTNCDTRGSSVTCRTSGGQYVPPRFAAVDDNEYPREQAIRSCFFANGWTPVKD